MLPIFSLIFSFRLFKFFYSGFFGLDNCMAHFEDPGNAIVKHVKRKSIFVFCLVYVPAMVGSIVAFFTVHWGYQAMICAIETFLIFILLLIFFVLELVFE